MKPARVVVLLAALLASTLTFADGATPRELAQTRALLAIEYMKIGNMRVALENADQSIKFDPTFQAGYLARALIYMQLGVDTEAEAAFNRALKLDAANPEVNNNFGWYLCSRGRYEEAIARFDRALADPLYQSPQSAMVNKAACLVRMDQRPLANQWLLAALRRAPNDSAALRELLNLSLLDKNVTLATFYYERLKFDERRMSPAELMMGIRLARLKQDQAMETRLADYLKTRFPDTGEAQMLLSGN